MAQLLNSTKLWETSFSYYMSTLKSLHEFRTNVIVPLSHNKGTVNVFLPWEE